MNPANQNPLRPVEFILPEPPEPFLELRARLRAAIDAGGQGSHRLRGELEGQFGACFDLRAHWFARPWRLFGSSAWKWPQAGPFPCDDHRTLWLRNRRAVAYTSQPYWLDLDQLREFARLHGLRFAVSESWSWWYPGKTRFIWWERDKTVARPPAWDSD